MSTGNKYLLVITGPTGVGKTDTGIELASTLNTEILSADSRQFYREMSIGTAVPDKTQVRRIPHHFIQHLSIHDYYSASRFEQDALAVLHRLFEKKEVVILLGGSMLYVDAVVKGIDDIPDVEDEIRRHYVKKYQEEGIESLRLELKTKDPLHYQKVDLKNPKRLLRALEIIATTGKPYSSFLTHKPKKRPFKTLQIALQREREELYQRINLRVNQMMENGLCEEAEKLRPYRELNALNTVGYKELFSYFDGEIPKEEAVRLIQRNTRTFARKQLTWWKKNEAIHWFHPEETDEILKCLQDEQNQK